MNMDPTTTVSRGSSSARRRLSMSTYDRVSSWLVTLLTVVGTAVTGLLIVYFTRQLIFAQKPVPVTPVEAGGRPADAAMGLKRDIEPPGIEEVPEILRPQLQDTLSAISSAVTSRTALLSDEDLDATESPGHGSGLGDNRQPGTGRGTGPPEPHREIRFEPNSVRHYAEWLDHFGIELGVFGSDNRIYYAYNLSRQRPSVREGAPRDENRLYLIPTYGQFAALDRRLAERAGISDKGQIIVQFYPPETEALLLKLEQEKAGDRPRTEIQRTVFRVTPVGDGFEMSVEEQTYRGGART